MIKPLVRWSATLGIAGASFFGWGIVENLIAVALPQEKIVEKLQQVPVFAVLDDQGSPLVAAGEGDSKFTPVYINKQDATKELELLKTQKPEIAEKVQVAPLPLSEVYKLSESEQFKENDLNFAYIPNKEAVDTAKTIISETGQEPYQGGVPLFFISGENGQDLVFFEQNSQPVAPLFFDKAQLDSWIARVKEQQPEEADNLNTGVVLLENLIQNLKTSEDEMLENIVLVPSAESIEAAQSLQQQQGLPAGEAPAEAPAEAAPAE